MTDIDYARIADTARQQESLLRFARFTNKDAWELGSFLVGRAENMGVDMAVSIRKPNGNIVFQYCSPGTTQSNENWMRRKFNTVALTEGSSLRAWASSSLKGQDLPSQGLSTADYALCGGGFPIRLKSGEMVAVLTASNLPHMEDHAFIVESLSEWLGADDVPAV